MNAPSHRFLTAALASLLALGAARPANAVTVFDYLAEPSVRIESLQPMPEPVRAILAYYAMRASSHCENPSGGGPLQCQLTRALGFASQCSPSQIELVATWFPDGAPPLDRSADPTKPALPVKPAELQEACNAIPDTAAQRSQWETLRLDRVGDQIQIHAVLAWTSGPGRPHGRVSMETRFLVQKDRITVLRHGEKSLD